jgi:hypothetical protein
MQSYELACRVTGRRFKTFRYGLAQTFLETAPHHRFNEYMNLALTAKKKTTITFKKVWHSRWFCWQYIK